MVMDTRSGVERAALAVYVLWSNMSSKQRRQVNENQGHEFYRALHALGVEIDATARGRGDDDPDHVVMPDPVNRAPSVSGFYCGPQDGEARKVREFALDEARKSWGGTMSEDAERHAHNIILIARMFENYLSEETS